MKKQLTTMILAISVILGVTACGGGVSQEEYDKWCSSRFVAESVM